ncbi:hypothetical protein MMA231_04171 (plasmid) [Asticcacaulis sp. MM231]
MPHPFDRTAIGFNTRKLFRTGRPTKPVSLRLFAAFCRQTRILRFCFNTFGSHCRAETLAKSDNGTDNGKILRRRGQVGYEGTIDLKFVEWEASEVGQTRIACSEVIQGHTNTQGFKLMQNADVLLAVRQKNRIP